VSPPSPYPVATRAKHRHRVRDPFECGVVGWLRVSLALALTVLAGCKPASEPDFPWGAPPDGYPSSGSESGSSDVGLVRVDEPTAERSREGSVDSPTTGADVGQVESGDAGAVATGQIPGQTTDEPAPDVEEPPPIERGRDVNGETPGAVTERPDVEAPTADTSAPPVADAGPEPAAVAEVEPAPEKAPGLDALELTADERAALARKASRKERVASRDHNRRGLKHHKARRYDEAITAYVAAIEADPEARYPRFNLACAYSLTGQPEGALKQLLALRELGHHDKIADARVDPDFAPMRKDPRFRRLTGFGEVLVYRAAAVPSRAVADLIDAIEKRAHYPARDAGTAARIEETRILRKSDHAAAADLVGDLVPDVVVANAHGRWLDVDAAVILLVADGADVELSAERLIEPFTGAMLRGRSSLGTHELRIKSTGFFTETIVRPALAGQIRRSGTWKVEGDELVRSYRETHETEDTVGEPTEETDRLTIGTKGSKLVLDGVAFRR